MRKTRIYKDKPIMVGQTTLDKSNELMYQFCYYYLLPKYKHNIKYIDTDSFILEIDTNDFYEVIKGDVAATGLEPRTT